MSLFRTALSACGLAAGCMLLLTAGPAAAAAQHPDTITVVPKFERFTKAPAGSVPPPTSVPHFLLNWSYNSQSYSASIVGSVPTGAGKSIPIYIIPVQLKYGTSSFNPNTLQSNGKSALTITQKSPLFTTGVDFVAGGVDFGKTQYINAFQRGNFWLWASSHPTWHTNLGKPTVLPLQTITVPTGSGVIGYLSGTPILVANIGYVDAQLEAILAANPQIKANALPIFMIYNSYLSNNNGLSGCCIGGYHTYNGSIAYAEFGYIGLPGAFAQDVAALSHELGEWADDPFVNNNSPCGLLENADPLEGEANFGDYTYTEGGFAYHLQDMVWMPYFGANTSVGNQMSFQNASLTVCQNGS